jgi:hypothetical protein
VQLSFCIFNALTEIKTHHLDSLTTTTYEIDYNSKATQWNTNIYPRNHMGKPTFNEGYVPSIFLYYGDYNTDYKVVQAYCEAMRHYGLL